MADVRGNGIGIRSVAACLPREIRTNDHWTQYASTPEGAIDQATRAVADDQSTPAWAAARRWVADPFKGARERRVIDDAHESSDLELAACRRALMDADLTPKRVRALIGYSQVSDDAGPGNHGIVANRLGLGPQLLAMTVETGCASFVTALELGTRLGADGSHALLYQSSATSRITDPADTTGPQMGDGAMAEVIGPVEGGLGFVDALQILRAEYRDALVLAPLDGRKRWYDGGDKQARMVMTARAPVQAMRLGVLGAEFCREACGGLLARNGLTGQDVDFFVCAQAGAWFGEACARTLDLPDHKYTPPEDHFQKYGHLLAASAPLNLWVAWTTGKLRKGDLVLIYSPGVGFTQAAALLRWSLDPPTAEQKQAVVP